MLEKGAQKVFYRLVELRRVEEKLTDVSRQPLAEERSGEWRVLGDEQAGAKNAQAGVPVPQKSAQPGMAVLHEPKHPSQRKIVNAGGGKIIGVLGCVAQQEGEGIFERAPWVSLVCGSASYRKLPQLIAELESGNRPVTCLYTHTTQQFETDIPSRRNPVR